jgi:hypothetical protein
MMHQMNRSATAGKLEDPDGRRTPVSAPLPRRGTDAAPGPSGPGGRRVLSHGQIDRRVAWVAASAFIRNVKLGLVGRCAAPQLAPRGRGLGPDSGDVTRWQQFKRSGGATVPI